MKETISFGQFHTYAITFLVQQSSNVPPENKQTLQPIQAPKPHGRYISQQNLIHPNDSKMYPLCCDYCLNLFIEYFHDFRSTVNQCST